MFLKVWLTHLMTAVLLNCQIRAAVKIKPQAVLMLPQTTETIALTVLERLKSHKRFQLFYS